MQGKKFQHTLFRKLLLSNFQKTREQIKKKNIRLCKPPANQATRE